MKIGIYQAFITFVVGASMTPKDQVAEQLRNARLQYGGNINANELNVIYDEIIPPFYNTTAMLSYAFNGTEASECGWCPCLCYYCPPKSISCCQIKVADDPSCRHCNYPDGECDQCRDGFSLNPDKKCTPNNKCTHTRDGVCVKCEKPYSVSKLTLTCFENIKCNRSNNDGECKRCDKGYYLNDAAACIKKTRSPSLHA